MSGWDPGAAHPDRGAVTCRRCLKLTTQEPADEQLELFGVAAPSRAVDSAAPATEPLRMRWLWWWPTAAVCERW
ncbi:MULTISPECIES: hypothetical protein [unclassified Streptosporangium]|uniref:hypothetical protein n=1 Tax=unclassified Streptosporangium TaxID=2632669 RepID=UPI002E2B8666|nr:MULTISPECIES: hypothetical protein [unclassified Streptosporangium]